MKTILISTGGSGGHVNPALSLFDHLKNNFKIFLVTDLRGLKFIDKKFKVNYSDINLKNLRDYSEIILVGSGKGVVSVNNVQGMKWRRKSLKYYKILKNYYEKAVTKCPRYYSWSINLTILQI